MRTVYKYELLPNVKIEMPIGAALRTVMSQGDQLFLWAEIDTTKPTEMREFQVFGTGHEIPNKPGLSFIGTAQMGPLVWHVYEVLEYPIASTVL